jgi:hypothetical protein
MCLGLTFCLTYDRESANGESYIFAQFVDSPSTGLVDDGSRRSAYESRGVSGNAEGTDLRTTASRRYLQTRGSDLRNGHILLTGSPERPHVGRAHQGDLRIQRADRAPSAGVDIGDAEKEADDR